ncbi:hypothetical protein R5R35_002638 [Gryllus longicercus]|uniref:Ima1 N-terminal domain-containing protein n=1 Tax=Gryllus longicercus TaxID=2509291 RepID=A0AAN9Z8U8_9ORTH
MFLGESWPFSLVPALLIAIPISVLILVYAYVKVRPKFPVRVICWFCHKRSDVPYDNWNCWDCPHCEQYNGFSTDGGYNKVIPAQHDELLNHSVTAKSSPNKKSPPVSSKTPFCRKCTINQDLKIQQLASFTPRDPASFDEEVEEYRQHLERAYQLCESCELVVKKTLRQQQGWLLDQHRQHQLSLRSQSSQRVIAWWQRGLPVSWLQRGQIASSFAALSLLVSHNQELLAKSFNQYMSPDLAYALEIAPKYDHIMASVFTIALIIVTGCSAYRRRIDIITAVLWFVLLVHKWLLFWPYLRTCVSEEDLRVGHVIVIGFTFLVTIVAAVTSRQVCPSKQLQMKKLKQDSDSVCRGRDISEHFKSSVAVEPSSGKSSCPPSDSSLSHTPASPAAGHIDSEQYSSIQQSPSERPTSMCSTFSPSEELEWVLGKLSIGPRNIRNKNGSVFKTKSYSTASGERIFEHEHQPAVNNGGESNLLRPSKLNFRRNVTQTSWVAGGYWRELGGTLSKAVQSGRNLLETSFLSPSSSPVSRSSSQSSGFHSHSSNSPASSPNSYSGSMCGGEGDRFSVLSEHAAPMVTCHCGSSVNNAVAVSKLPFMGMQYYGGFPVCVPHVCPLSVATTPSGLAPRSIPWIANSQYFQSPKHCFPGSYCFPPFPHPTVKQLPSSHTAASDALSHSGSKNSSKLGT